MSEHIEPQSRAETRRSTPDAAAPAGAPIQQAFPGVVSGTSILALQRAIGNKATVGVLQRGGTYNPKQMAMMASQKARAADAEREGAEARKKAAEFNAARATIDRDPRYQKMVADSSSKKQKVLDAVSGALKGSMAQAWEGGSTDRGYGGRPYEIRHSRWRLRTDRRRDNCEVGHQEEDWPR